MLLNVIVLTRHVIKWFRNKRHVIKYFRNKPSCYQMLL